MASKKWAVVPHDFGMSEFMGTGEPPIQIIDGDGNTVACNTTFYPTQITAEHAATIVAAVNGQAEMQARIDELEKALMPFAEQAERYDPPQNDSGNVAWNSPFHVGDLRDARTALTRKEPTNV